jgi:hypothetical protein
VPGFVNYKKGCTRLTAASDKVYQLLAHGWWFSPSTPASSTTKTGRHDIAEILLKVVLKHQNKKINHALLVIGLYELLGNPTTVQPRGKTQNPRYHQGQNQQFADHDRGQILSFSSR